MAESRDPLSDFHARVDAAAARLAERHRERLHCGRGCSMCCRDELTVFAVEAEHIRAHHDDLLQREAPHPPGACAFLDAEGACRIYAERPYVCRSQGLPLRWFEDAAEGGVVEHRDICPLNEEGSPLESLPDADCWLLGPCEDELRAIQRALCGDEQRIALRSLFRRRASRGEESSINARRGR